MAYQTGGTMTVAAAVATRNPSGSATAEGARIDSLDLWRGVVMVLMAIDHVRVYSGLPAGGPTAGIFFTRWVTHFCAPAFVFLAGTAAFLYGRKAGLHAVSRYLFTRGVALVLMEVTIIRLSWTFTLASLSSPLAGVIWMLGWCMVLMAGLVRLSIAAVTVVGLVLVFGQDIVGGAAGGLPFLGAFLYSGGEVQLGAAGPTFSILYTIIPWIGVMALGYAFGAIVVRPAEERHRAFVRIGVAATAAFLVLGGAVVAFSPAGDGPPALFQLLNQRKYPASPLYLLMTLGPPIALLPLVERARGALAGLFTTFGRVPMFYYLLHIPVIHLIALLVWKIRDGQVHPEWFASAPYVSVPPEQRWSLALLYLVFAVTILALYFPCRWFAGVKKRSSSALLRYV
jgi:uncharacterized membrane protein